MHLYLSGSSHLNSSYTNEDGQVLYRVVTPAGIQKTSTVTCVVPNDVSRGEGDDALISMHDTYAHVGTVEHNPFTSSVLRWGGNQFETKSYFRKERFPYGRNRIFTGRDGREYKWLLRSLGSSKLIVNDEARDVVAQFHRRSFGILGTAHPASLEISAIGKHMIEEILITFIYAEKMRRDRERAIKRGVRLP